VGRPRGHSAGAALTLPTQRGSVWMDGRRLRWIAEDVVEPVHEGANPLFRRLEHMFVRLDRASDGTGLLQQNMQDA
jgi:hypothetical protein